MKKNSLYSVAKRGSHLWARLNRPWNRAEPLATSVSHLLVAHIYHRTVLQELGGMPLLNNLTISWFSSETTVAMHCIIYYFLKNNAPQHNYKRRRRRLGSNLRPSVLPDRRCVLVLLVILNIILFILFCYGKIYTCIIEFYISIFWIFQCIFLLVPLTFIIKLAGAVDSTTPPTAPEKSVVNAQCWFFY